jgi:hypothetical protein
MIPGNHGTYSLLTFMYPVILLADRCYNIYLRMISWHGTQ